jgi:cytochrome c556
MSRIKVGIVAVFLIGMLGFAGYKLRTEHVTASAPASVGTQQALPPNHEDLRKFMQARVHQEYTFLSFTIWHDRPLTPEKMDSIAASSSRVIGMSKDLTAYGDLYRSQGWSAEDVKFFEEKRVQLSRVAEELNRAAQNRNSPEVINFFMHLDTTCQSCHKRFRPDLQWL